MSFGAGVNTTALMVLLTKKKMPLDVAVFADTGDELPETYETVKVAQEYLARYGVELVTVKSKNSTLYETCMRRKVIPSKVWRWSTRDFKIRPIHAYYKSLNSHIFEYLGIAYDEVERMKASKEGYITSLFPLIDRHLTRSDCVSIIEKAGLPMPIKSGCFICPFSPIWRWKYIHDAHPALYRKAMRLEESTKFYPSVKLTGQSLRGLAKQRFKVDGRIPLLPADEPCGAYCMA